MLNLYLPLNTWARERLKKMKTDEQWSQILNNNHQTYKRINQKEFVILFESS